MKYTKISSVLIFALALFLPVFTSCDKDQSTNGTSGQVRLEITDGPSDDPDVKAVFITVAEVKIDGQVFDGFSGKKTIDLLTYQQGDVAALGLGELEAGSYSQISLVLDTQTDENGNSPGCYVQTLDNAKHSLSVLASHTVTASNNFVVEAGSTTELVLDFDLRKAIQYNNSGSEPYSFVGAADLQSAMRLVVKSESGNMQGTCQNSIILADKIVAYAYHKGAFDRNTEISASNGVAFKNAISSCAVGPNGEFNIAFFERGEYEIHFAAYQDDDQDGDLEFQGTLIVDGLIDLNSIMVSSTTELDLNIMVIGILP